MNKPCGTSRRNVYKIFYKETPRKVTPGVDYRRMLKKIFRKLYENVENGIHELRLGQIRGIREQGGQSFLAIKLRTVSRIHCLLLSSANVPPSSSKSFE